MCRGICPCPRLAREGTRLETERGPPSPNHPGLGEEQLLSRSLISFCSLDTVPAVQPQVPAPKLGRGRGDLP